MTIRVLEARSLELRCSQGYVLWDGLREQPFFASSQLLVDTSHPWCPMSGRCLTLIFASDFLTFSLVCLHLCLFFSSFKDTSHINLRAYLFQYNPILINYVCNEPSSKIRLYSEVLGVKASTYLLGGQKLNPSYKGTTRFHKEKLS
jgi:hypothetical protein